MQFITINESVHFNNPVYGNGMLVKGKTYYTFGQFARETTSRGFCRILNEHKPKIVNFQPPHLFLENGPKRILLMFSGGLGDAVTVSIVIPRIIEKYNLILDICCAEKKWEDIFRPMGVMGRHVRFPPDLQTLSDYDAVLHDITVFYSSNEGLTASPVIQLLRGFGIEGEDLHCRYEIPVGINEKCRLPKTDRIRIGFNPDSNGLVKSYPEKLLESLLKALAHENFDIYIFGVGSNRNLPNGIAGIADLRGKTSIPELAALLEQMDVVLCVDSFSAHLANILRKPTMVLLSTTAPSSFKWHQYVTCLSSRMTCSPCFGAFDDCHKEYSECRAFYHDSIRPEFIAKEIKNYLSRKGLCIA